MEMFSNRLVMVSASRPDPRHIKVVWRSMRELKRDDEQCVGWNG